MSRSRSRAAREKDDTYKTPPWCLARLLERANIPLRGRWFEPCAADGGLIRAAVDLGVRADSWTATEIRGDELAALERSLQYAATKAAEPISFRGVATIADFLKIETDHFRLFPTANKLGAFPFDVIVTNPPYSLAEKFITRCRLLAPIVAMPLRMNFLAGAKRSARLDMPRETWILPNRPRFVGGKADACEYAWMIWTPGACDESRTRRLANTPIEVRRAEEGTAKKPMHRRRVTQAVAAA